MYIKEINFLFLKETVGSDDKKRPGVHKRKEAASPAAIKDHDSQITENCAKPKGRQMKKYIWSEIPYRRRAAGGDVPEYNGGTCHSECETKEQSNRIGTTAASLRSDASRQGRHPVESDRVNFIGATLRAVTTKCSPFLQDPRFGRKALRIQSFPRRVGATTPGTLGFRIEMGDYWHVIAPTETM
ncbi:hypothetical protein EVAR_103606_1 [Eumeta japonica]|uniref:Uncharacterized protein n=1 Tax=Eumeta variegata TaxID=151549 RepID=A0A4C1ZA06_EUMVA|nr:hypothetical protein EVAR_103606_1 [Eumeta japonica]